jgi:coenzyme PQQ synthesis protein D (PqqD)
MTISSHSTVVTVDSQTSCELNAETVILDFNKGAYFGLDEIGTLIWRLLQQPQPVSALCDAVTEQYEVTRATCEQDVIHLLETLHAEGLIEVRSASTR